MPAREELRLPKAPGGQDGAALKDRVSAQPCYLRKEVKSRLLL